VGTNYGDIGSDIYKYAVENMDCGFAYNRIIVDTNGEPVDYIILDVNNAFEQLVGLDRKDILTRRAMEILPGTIDSNYEWIRICGKAALSCTKAQFESVFEPLEKWCSVSVFSSRKGYFHTIIHDITDRKTMKSVIKESQEKFKVLSEQNMLGITVIQDGRIKYANQAFAEIMEYPVEEIIKWDIDKLSNAIHHEDRDFASEQLRKKLQGDLNAVYRHAYRVITCNKHEKWLEVYSRTILYSGKKAVFVTVIDISDRKKAEEVLQLNQSRLNTLIRLSQMSHLSLNDIVDFAHEEGIKLTRSKIGYVAFLNDDETELLIYSWSKGALAECTIKDRAKLYKLETTGLWGEAVRQRKSVITNDYEAPNPYKKGYPEGHIQIKRHMNVPVFDGERIVAVAGVANKEEPYNDTDALQLTLMMDGMWQCFKRKRAEEEIRYLSYHDRLTGLYNRTFFDQEIKRLDTEKQLPVSLIIGDVNGLKLANDVFGHQEGDRLLQKIADILKYSCRNKDIIARWGGDEFAVILPNTSLHEAYDICDRIKEECSKADKDTIQPSIALGTAVKDDPSKGIQQVLKEAEDRMYRRKLLESKSTRSAIISSLEKTLFERSFETEEHAKRLLKYSLKIGQALSLSQNETDDLRLLSILHDIGKIAVPDSILVKPGRLSLKEWEEMKKHAEIGYRIAESSKELDHIADYILSHHERWDGTGYPQGLKGEKIPRLSRILAIADAFDAMTHERPYKKAISRKEALEEIRRCSGTQFDPEIVQIFLQVIENKK